MGLAAAPKRRAFSRGQVPSTADPARTITSVRVLFWLYLLVPVAGIVLYALIGLTEA
ncbi:MAG: hypothetical protein ACRDN6_02135 [Gaiellaceae bacterium]